MTFRTGQIVKSKIISYYTDLQTRISTDTFLYNKKYTIADVNDRNVTVVGEHSIKKIFSHLEATKFFVTVLMRNDYCVPCKNPFKI